MAERIVCCGSRNWQDYHRIRHELGRIQMNGRIARVIHGDCRGADRLAAAAALRMGIPVTAWPALWREYGAAAGPLRNQQMLDEESPTLVLAFHDDIENSRGTKDLARRAEKAGVPVRIVTSNDKEGA